MSLRAFLLSIPLLSGGLPAHSQRTARPVFTSAYTDMKKQCRTLPETAGDEGGDPAAQCTGYGGYRLFMYYSAASAVVGVQRVKDGTDVLTLGTEYGAYGGRGEKIEWRMADGKPFAVIMRVGKYSDVVGGTRTGSTMVVKGLPGWECLDAEVDGSLPDANVRARTLADARYKGR